MRRFLTLWVVFDSDCKIGTLQVVKIKKLQQIFKIIAKKAQIKLFWIFFSYNLKTKNLGYLKFLLDVYSLY